MKKYLCVCMMIICLGAWLSFENCGEKGRTSAGHSKISDEEKTQRDVILEVTIDADFAEDCGSLRKLDENADYVVSGTVIKAEAWCDEACTVYTDYTVQINDVYKGNFKQGNQIVITDIGGMIEADKYFKYQNDPKALSFKKAAKGKKNSYVQYKFEGAWLPDEGNSYVWYLEDNSVGSRVHYNPVNAYQGVFEVIGQSVQRYESDKSGKENRIGKIAISKMEKSIRRK